MENLDLKCAELGQRIASDSSVTEKSIAESLGVLEEQGLYAACLYLKAQKDRHVLHKVEEFLRKISEGVPAASENGEVLDLVRMLSRDLDQMLFARDLVRQAFVYARYHIKARP